MIRALQHLIFAALASFVLAAPTNTLSKRSFKALAKGHGRLDPVRELLKTSRKYGRQVTWEEIIFLGQGNSGIIASFSLQPPSPFSTPASSSYLTVSAVDPVTPSGYGSSTPTAVSAVHPSSYGSSATVTPTPVTSLAPSPTQDTEDGEVTATPEDNESEYLSPVSVGGQQLNLNFDTGSADLWVFSSQLTSRQTRGHAAFDPAKSSTWQVLPGSTWNISYGDGSGAQGTVGYDTVDVGGTTVQKQCVEIADDVSPEFVKDVNSDGLLGLAFSSINTVEPVQQKTFFENVMGDLTLPVFTADLEETDGSGTYEFGTIDKAKYKGKIHYTPIDKSLGFWKFDTPAFQVDGQQSTCPGCWAFADTGTSLLYLNRDFVAKYYAQVPGASYTYPGAYTYDCSSKLPDLSIVIGGYPATIKGADMTYSEFTPGVCFGGLQSLDEPCTRQRCPPASEMQIIGDVFLKQFFAVFDGGNVRFGIAEKK